MPGFAMVNRIRAGSDEEFRRVVEAFRGRLRAVEGAKGFRGLLVLANRDRREVVVVTLWDSRDSFVGWVESREFREAHERARLKGIRAESEGVEYEVVDYVAAKP